MKREEIQAKIAELQAQLDEMDKEVTYGELKAGDRFKWCGLTFVKLKNNLALLDDLEDVKGKYCMFDPYDNNYNKSMIRQYINGKFLKINNIDISELDYVYEHTDYATLLSKEEYEENQDIITQIAYRFCLRSPDAYDSGLACYLGNYGTVYDNLVYDVNAVRATFNLKSDTKVSIIKE